MGIGCRDVFAVLALESGIVILLKTVKTLVIGTRKADHVRGEGAVGIVARGLRACIDHIIEIVLVNEGENFVLFLFFNAFLDLFILAVCLVCFFVNGFVINLQNLGKLFGNHFIVGNAFFFLGLLDIVGRNEDQPHGFVRGKQIAVCIEDIAALGGKRGAERQLLNDLLLVEIVVDDLDLEKHADQKEERSCEDDEHDLSALFKGALSVEKTAQEIGIRCGAFCVFFGAVQRAPSFVFQHLKQDER